MKKMEKKLMVFFIVATIVSSLFGCGPITGFPKLQDPPMVELPYNAERIQEIALFDGYNGWESGPLNEQFVNENRLKFKYKNLEWQSGDDSSNEYFYDETMPEDRVFIVNNQNEYDEIFSLPLENFSQSINFETSMIIVYMYVGYDNGKHSFITDLSLKGNDLTVDYVSVQTYQDGFQYRLKILFFKIDKMELSSVQFKQLKEYKGVYYS